MFLALYVHVPVPQTSCHLLSGAQAVRGDELSLTVSLHSVHIVLGVTGLKI